MTRHAPLLIEGDPVEMTGALCGSVAIGVPATLVVAGTRATLEFHGDIRLAAARDAAAASGYPLAEGPRSMGEWVPWARSLTGPAHTSLPAHWRRTIESSQSPSDDGSRVRLHPLLRRPTHGGVSGAVGKLVGAVASGMGPDDVVRLGTSEANRVGAGWQIAAERHSDRARARAGVVCPWLDYLIWLGIGVLELRRTNGLHEVLWIPERLTGTAQRLHRPEYRFPQWASFRVARDDDMDVSAASESGWRIDRQRVGKSRSLRAVPDHLPPSYDLPLHHPYYTGGAPTPMRGAP